MGIQQTLPHSYMYSLKSSRGSSKSLAIFSLPLRSHIFRCEVFFVSEEVCLLRMKSIKSSTYFWYAGGIFFIFLTSCVCPMTSFLNEADQPKIQKNHLIRKVRKDSHATVYISLLKTICRCAKYNIVLAAESRRTYVRDGH